MFRKKYITAWLAAALICVSAPLSLAQNHRNEKPAQNRPNQSVPRPPQNQNRTPNDGHHAGQWLRQYRGMPYDQQKKSLENDPNYRKLPPERQQRFQQRLQQFNSLPPERQERVLNRMETWEHLTPDQKTQARQLYSGMRNLPPERRAAMRNAINALRAMPPDARERAINSGRFNQFSPQEREMLNGAAKLPLAPAEAEQAPPQ